MIKTTRGDKETMSYTTPFKASKKTTRIFSAIEKHIWYSPQQHTILLKPDDFKLLLETAPDYLRKNHPPKLFYKGYDLEIVPHDHPLAQ